MRVHVQTNKGRQVIQTIGEDVNYYPIDLSKLDLFNEVQWTHLEVQSGNLVLNAWTNPAVPSSQINNTQMFSLSYLFLLYYLKLRDTRDIWKTFPNIPVKTLSYMRERAFFFKTHLSYKIAILKCLHRGLTSSEADNVAVRRTFRECGLSPDNYIYYNVLFESGEFKQLELMSPLLLDIKALEKELEDFARQPQTIKLCRFHARAKLSFIAKGNNFDVDDLATELKMNTLASYRLCRPMMSVEYSENYARRAMTNTVQRIITSQTSHAGKNNMWQTKTGGFTMRFNRLEDEMGDFDPTDLSVRASLGFSEDDMIEHITLRRILDEKVTPARAQSKAR